MKSPWGNDIIDMKACLRYEVHRHILQEANEKPDLGGLLGVEEGLEATVKFLDKMDRSRRQDTDIYRNQPQPTEGDQEIKVREAA